MLEERRKIWVVALHPLRIPFEENYFQSRNNV
jgi:hypothetical protein